MLGAPSVAWFSVPPGLDPFVAGEPAQFLSSEHATRSFCPTGKADTTYQRRAQFQRPRRYDLLAR